MPKATIKIVEQTHHDDIGPYKLEIFSLVIDGITIDQSFTLYYLIELAEDFFDIAEHDILIQRRELAHI